MKDVDTRLASDLSLAIVRMARQLRFRRPESTVSMSQLSALATLHKEGAMTPGALAVRERVRPPSMTRVVASLAELGLVGDGPNSYQIWLGGSLNATRLAETFADRVKVKVRSAGWLAGWLTGWGASWVDGRLCH